MDQALAACGLDASGSNSDGSIAVWRITSSAVVPGSGNSRLRVSLWPRALRVLPFAWADYWILHVDPDYGAALVGHPNRRFLWILSRRPVLPDARLHALIGMAAERGYPVERLKFNVDA